MMSDKELNAFCEKYGDDVGSDVLERISEAAWSPKDAAIHGVTILDIHTHNACNHTYSGRITHDGIEWGFVIDSGDWNGTQVREWGHAENVRSYDPPKPTRYDFVPIDPTPKALLIHAEWKKTEWFQEKLRGYHYDRHFQPGIQVETHYRNWAAEKGMKIVLADDSSD
jgi:hypothetical protein